MGPSVMDIYVPIVSFLGRAAVGARVVFPCHVHLDGESKLPRPVDKLADLTEVLCRSALGHIVGIEATRRVSAIHQLTRKLRYIQ